MANDNIIAINKRLAALEEEPERERDILITVLTEQHEHVGDELRTIHREPIGYSEVEWSGPDNHGRRHGVRYAKYASDAERGSNWTDEQLNHPKPVTGVTGD
jgi:hypothetical protein